MWIFYALLLAFFASLTAIFAKIGVKDVNTDLATAIRTVVILILAWGIAFFRGDTILTSTSKHKVVVCNSDDLTGYK
jgi:transporter family protein